MKRTGRLSAEGGTAVDLDIFDVSGASDIGQKRTENQDHFLVANLRRQLIVEQTDVADKRQAELFGCQEGKLLVVADGMGGVIGGEEASRTAVEACARYVLDMMQWFLKLSPDDEQDFEVELSECLKAVQRKIWANGELEVRRMGTTVTMAYLLWPRMFVVHAGDSRCYLMRDGKLKQLTTDHTIAQQLVDSGGLTHRTAMTKARGARRPPRLVKSSVCDETGTSLDAKGCVELWLGMVIASFAIIQTR